MAYIHHLNSLFEFWGPVYYVGWTNQEPKTGGLHDESISEVKIATKDEVLAMIDAGEITDPTIIAALEIIIRKYL